MGGSSGKTGNIFPHETTIDVDTVYLSNPISSIGTVTAPASVVVNDQNGRINTAASEVGSGLIIAIADEIFFNSVLGIADNQLFAHQVFDWLSGTVSWLLLEPSNGTIAAGQDTVVIVTMDGTDLRTGDYAANIIIKSNDPVTPTDSTPVYLYVLEYLCGDANADGVVDTLDFEYLFQTYFYHGPSSMPANSTDLNCNNIIDLADIIILSKYLNGSITIDCCNGSLFSKQSVSLEIKMRQQSSSLLK